MTSDGESMPEDPSNQEDPDEGIIQVKMSWVGLEEEPVAISNQFISQFDDHLFYLSFGLVIPPVILGSPEDKKRIIEELDYVPVETLARISLTPSSMRELIGVLRTNLSKYEKKHGSEEESA